MADPLKSITQMQQAWVGAWANSAQHMMQCWTHVFAMQQHFMKVGQEAHRGHVEISSGPSFTDKYGKRAHDIDPERDV